MEVRAGQTQPQNPFWNWRNPLISHLLEYGISWSCLHLVWVVVHGGGHGYVGAGGVTSSDLWSWLWQSLVLKARSAVVSFIRYTVEPCISCQYHSISPLIRNLAPVRNLKWHAKRLRHPVQWKRWLPRLGPIDILKVCQVGLPNMHELRIPPRGYFREKYSFTSSCFLFPTCLRPCFFSQRNLKQNSRHPNASMWWLKMILNLMVRSPYKMSPKMDDLVGSTMKTWATWSLTRR